MHAPRCIFVVSGAENKVILNVQNVILSKIITIAMCPMHRWMNDNSSRDCLASVTSKNHSLLEDRKLNGLWKRYHVFWKESREQLEFEDFPMSVERAVLM